MEGLEDPLDVIVLFVTELDDLAGKFRELWEMLATDGGMWVAWPKKASKIESDLTFELVQEVGLAAGLVDNKSCAIDLDWQALRFVYRKKDRNVRPPL